MASGNGPSGRCATTKREMAAASGDGPTTKKPCSAEREAEEQPAAAAPTRHRMKKREIRYILNHKPFSVVPRVYEALKQSNPDLTPSPEEEADEAKKNLYAGARAFYEAEEKYPAMQEWVRRELADKGYVEVDDEWVRREAESKEILQELQDKIDALLLEHPQTEDEDDDDSDSDYSDED
ncbi:unnamed protein product [Urochloa humidicola]